MKSLEINVHFREVYGQRKLYPACAKAELFTTLTGTKTLSIPQIQHIKQLGYIVNVVNIETGTWLCTV